MIFFCTRTHFSLPGCQILACRFLHGDVLLYLTWGRVWRFGIASSVIASSSVHTVWMKTIEFFEMEHAEKQ